jgi:microcystin-dependent protein
MSDQFVGEIRIFGFNYAPTDWAFCDGTTIPAQQNPALFAILGKTYGGDGTTNFALPDLRGRAVMGQVAGSALNDPQGATIVTIDQSQIPKHTHTVYGDTGRTASGAPGGCLPARFTETKNNAFIATNETPAPVITQLAPQVVSPVGGGQAHENMQPYTVMNFCIALQGIWPQRP